MKFSSDSLLGGMGRGIHYASWKVAFLKKSEIEYTGEESVQ